MNRVSSKAEQTNETSKANRSNDELVSGDVNEGAVLPSDWTVPMSMKPRAGNLIVVTGPSGVGKGTVVSKLLQQIPNLTKSVSVTTREMRPNEIEGTDYFFRSAEEFEAMIDNGLFMEWAEFAGNLYGTPSAWVLDKLLNFDVILEIEVQGAKQISTAFPKAVLIFLSPPSLDELKKRLKGRATETAMKLTLRLAKARQEMRSVISSTMKLLTTI